MYSELSKIMSKNKLLLLLSFSTFTICNLDINATNSQFNHNAELSDISNTIASNGADSNAQAASGLFVFNNSGTSGNLTIDGLTNSNFGDNGVGTTGFGIYGFGLSGTGTTAINYTGAIFSGFSQQNTNQGDGDANVTWIP